MANTDLDPIIKGRPTEAQAYVPTVLDEQVLEDLVNAERIPLFQPAETGYYVDSDGRKVEFGLSPRMMGSGRYTYVREPIVLCYIPPEGTHFGDQMVRHHGGLYEFLSPAGESRGLAELISLTPQQAAPLESRLSTLLQ